MGKIIKWIKRLFRYYDLKSKLDKIESSSSDILLSLEKTKNRRIFKKVNDVILINPINQNQIFSFEKIKRFNEDKTRTLIDGNPSKILRALSSLPQVVSNRLVSESYRFKYPNGISGKVMQIAEGQGTAILDSNGKIVRHGRYVKGIVKSIPLFASTFANILIREHYLSKIDENLINLNKHIKTLIDFEFIKKEAKVQSIIYFFNKAFTEYNLICDNRNYRNSFLTNIINKNIEIHELIYFYKNSVTSTEEVDKEKLSKNLYCLLTLQDMFVYGKILEFKYAEEYNKELVNSLRNEFDQLHIEYSEFFRNNRQRINSLKNSVKYTFIDKKIVFGDLVGNRRKKSEQIDNLLTSTDFIDDLIKRSQLAYIEKGVYFLQFLRDIEQPKEYIIDDGKLFEIKNNLE